MSLQVWLPLTGTLNNQGLANVTVTNNNSAASNNSGKIGKCYSFNGSNQWLRANFTSAQTSAIGSLACWIKFNSFPASNSWMTVMKVCEPGGFAQTLLGISMQYTNQIAVCVKGSGSNLYTHSLQTGVWYHLCATYDGTIVKLYLNGSVVLSQTASTSSVTSAAQFHIGGSGGNYILNGYINDVRYYNHCLSPKEVEEISKGLVLHYKLDNNGIGCENILTNSSGYQGTSGWNGVVSTSLENNQPYLIAKRTDTTSTSRTFCTHSAITSYVSSWQSGDKFTLSGYYRVPSSETQTTTANMFIRWTLSSGTNDTGFSFSTASALKDTWIKFSYTYSVPTNYAGGAANFYLSAFSAGGIATTHWKNIKLEKGNQATSWSPAKADTLYSIFNDNIIYDSSGYNNNGTITGNLTATTPSSRYDCATYISDGATNYVTTPTLNLPGDQISINFWFKSSNKAAGSNYHMPLEASASSNQAYEMSITNAGVLRGGLVIGGSRKVDNCTSSKLTDGTWHMCTMTYDGTIIKRYVDAVMEKSTAATGALVTSTNFVLGHYGSNTSYCCKEANISDARIYTVALTENQVKELYNTSMSIDSSGNVHAREVSEL